MKVGYSHYYERHCELYSEFKCLWKVDDEQWVNHRKESWRKRLEEKGNTPHNKYIGEFYVFGKEPPSFFEDEETGERDHIEFRFQHRLAYTPLQTIEQVQSFYEKDQRNLQRNHDAARYVDGCLSGMPERDFKVKLVAQALYCDKYFMKERVLDGEKALVTIEPRAFVVGYSRVGFMFQDMDRHEWDYRVFTFDYFMKSVHYCEEQDLLKMPVHKKALPQMYETLLLQDDAALNSYRLELKQKLIAAAEADDAPLLLKNALKKAKENLEE